MKTVWGGKARKEDRVYKKLTNVWLFDVRRDVRHAAALSLSLIAYTHHHERAPACTNLLSATAG